MKNCRRDAFLQQTTIRRQILREGGLISINVLRTANPDTASLAVESKRGHGASGGAVNL